MLVYCLDHEPLVECLLAAVVQFQGMTTMPNCMHLCSRSLMHAVQGGPCLSTICPCCGYACHAALQTGCGELLGRHALTRSKTGKRLTVNRVHASADTVTKLQYPGPQDLWRLLVGSPSVLSIRACSGLWWQHLPRMPDSSWVLSSLGLPERQVHWRQVSGASRVLQQGDCITWHM